MGETSDGDRDLAACLAGFEVSYGVGHLCQRIRAIDDRDDLTGLDELAYGVEVPVPLLVDEHGEPLRNEGREGNGADLSADSRPPPAFAGADEVIDYTQADFAEGETRFDLIFDIGGNSRISVTGYGTSSSFDSTHSVDVGSKIDDSNPSEVWVVNDEFVVGDALKGH